MEKPPTSTADTLKGWGIVLVIGIFLSTGASYLVVNKFGSGIGPITYGEIGPGKSPETLSKGATTNWLFFILYWLIVGMIHSALQPDTNAEKLKALRAADREALEARHANLMAEITAERAILMEKVENDWQLSKQAEIAQQQAELDRQHAHYVSLLDRNHQLQADYEKAVQQQKARTATLEGFVIEAWPDFAQRFDPAGRLEPAEVSRAFREELAAKLPDLGLLRRTNNQRVANHLGALSLLPPAPPVPLKPILLPIPENLRQKFGR